jgi:hypothetical protein
VRASASLWTVRRAASISSAISATTPPRGVEDCGAASQVVEDCGEGQPPVSVLPVRSRGGEGVERAD